MQCPITLKLLLQKKFFMISKSKHKNFKNILFCLVWKTCTDHTFFFFEKHRVCWGMSELNSILTGLFSILLLFQIKLNYSSAAYNLLYHIIPLNFFLITHVHVCAQTFPQMFFLSKFTNHRISWWLLIRILYQILPLTAKDKLGIVPPLSLICALVVVENGLS